MKKGKLKWMILLAVSLLLSVSCRTEKYVAVSVPLNNETVQEHSPDVFLVMYDEQIGKDYLLKAVKDYGCEIVYDYGLITGMALKKPAEKSLEETMQFFRGVKGVVTVEYDHIYHLTDPVRPRLELR